MKTIALLAAAFVAASASPLRAQVRAVPAAPPAVPAAPAQPPKVTCPCDDLNFKPLNDKARAVAEYWAARRKHKSASTVSGLFGLFGMIARDPRVLQEAQNALNEADREITAARMKAESLGGIKVPGGDDKVVQILIKKDVDYTLTPPR
jgi:hypothetical protein